MLLPAQVLSHRAVHVTVFPHRQHEATSVFYTLQSPCYGALAWAVVAAKRPALGFLHEANAVHGPLAVCYLSTRPCRMSAAPVTTVRRESAAVAIFE
ncbi:hypothetical protein TruAng_009572 [Truncatella angustata]|nr:hypothetical protein TruAng_009572 [Truncatella angustata]